MRDLIDGEAELNDEEDDESFDEEAGETRTRTRDNMLDDSSEEDEDDEDEEEARRVRPCSFFLFVNKVILIMSMYRFEKGLSSMKMKRRRRIIQKSASAERRRSAAGLSARKRSNSTRKILTSSVKLTQSGNGKPRLRYVGIRAPTRSAPWTHYRVD
jgi:uncharacterized Zn finger protein (UPF0148 family)